MMKLIRFLKPSIVPIVFVLVLVFLQTLANLYLPTLMSDVIDNGVLQGNTSYIIKTGGFMLLVTTGSVAAAIMASFLSSKTSVGMGRDMRQEVFKKISNFSLTEFDKFGEATLITRTTNDIIQVQNVLLLIMRMILSAPMMCIGGIILAFSKDKRLTLILVGMLPILIVTITLIAKQVMPLVKVMQVKTDKINLVLREKLTGIRVIRAFNRYEDERKRFDVANLDFTNNYIKVNRIMAFLMPAIMLIMNLVIITIVWFGASLIGNGNMQLGTLVAFMQYAMQIMFALIMLSMMFIMAPRAIAAGERIQEVLDVVPVINDPAQSKEIKKGKGSIEFRNVSFSYEEAEKPALDQISFSVNPGEITAIIGSTGSGKTTLINLILRFYDVSSGAVLVNGIDVRELSQKKLREEIGFVSQESVLFSGTVTDNIKFGKDDATEDDVRYAANIAQASEFISELEGNYNYQVSQGGTNVSGGQKQRLSIARALIKRPDIYIFDDSFSALDFKTDAALRMALKKEIANSTVLIVAQRVGTVMDADRIIVLDNGCVSGIGTHKELLKTCEVYSEIVRSQLSEEEIA